MNKPDDQYQDISILIGDLFPAKIAPTCPMLSYYRPSSLFWQGVYNRLIDDGLEHDEALEILRAKNVRWMLDNHENDVTKLGYKLAGNLLNKSGT